MSLSVCGQRGEKIKANYYTLENTGNPIDLYFSAKKTFLITTNGIYEREEKKFLKKYTARGAIICALEDDSVFWIGTPTGLLRVNKKTFKSTPVQLPFDDRQPQITTILKDYAGTIWVGAEAYGVYKLQKGTFEKVLGVFPVNAGAVTSDSSVWIGTNTGLHQWKNNQWVRYNEEGVTNFEIPDNVVDKLKVDNKNNLWAVLSEGVTVFEAKSRAFTQEGHIPAVKFIGKPNNTIYSIIYVENQGYVFATAMGLLLLPENKGQLPPLEQSSTSDIVADNQLLYSIKMPGSNSALNSSAHPLLLKTAKRSKIWLIDNQGIQVFTNKDFIKVLQEFKKIKP
ncbi:hypothetical protein [Adhaeribacter pallidiroseus]|uniref:hypothetical protein n=1 Tax=Adhaeribacter pallidiroseus TaxID=2072847 RepID=UPI0011C05FA9|nr:hypothetical protein [Adhaeribacter pallidiroseus]